MRRTVMSTACYWIKYITKKKSSLLAWQMPDVVCDRTQNTQNNLVRKYVQFVLPYDKWRLASN